MIYLDNAATTRVRGEVLEEMLPYLTEEYGNPSGVYAIARSAHAALDLARERTAAALGAKYPREIFFTSCGTESDNWAIMGTAAAKPGSHIVTSAIEHHAVLETCAFLEKLGHTVTYVQPDVYGRISAEAVTAAMREDTAIVSVMHANNEIGTVNPISEIADAVHARGALFHVDAVQTAGHIPVDVSQLGADMLSISGHKFHAAKGVGALYVRSGLFPEIFIHGGAQERGRRAGTENLASIAGMGKAIELAVAELKETGARLTSLRDDMTARILSGLPNTRLNGHPSERLPGNVNISIKDLRAETILCGLDLAGISASSGSACTAGAIGISHVIKAIGVPQEYASGSIRFSFSRYTTREETDTAVDTLINIALKKI